MSKKKKNMTIEEAVGDTSGFAESQSSPKRKRIVIISGLAGIVVLLVLGIIFLSSPIKVEFYYQDGATQAVRYVVDKSTKKLENGPDDPIRTCYDFGGWYFNTDTTSGNGLFNNAEDKSLLDYVFTSKKNISLYARWTATNYKVNYNCKGNAAINTQVTNSLIEQNKKLNPETYTVKHTISNYERTMYVEELRKSDPDKYVNSADAGKNINQQIEWYTNETQKASITLNNLELSGFTFLGWFDENGNKVTELNRLDPVELNLTAQWQKN